MEEKKARVLICRHKNSFNNASRHVTSTGGGPLVTKFLFGNSWKDFCFIRLLGFPRTADREDLPAKNSAARLRLCACFTTTSIINFVINLAAFSLRLFFFHWRYGYVNDADRPMGFLFVSRKGHWSSCIADDSQRICLTPSFLCCVTHGRRASVLPQTPRRSLSYIVVIALGAARCCWFPSAPPSAASRLGLRRTRSVIACVCVCIYILNVCHYVRISKCWYVSEISFTACTDTSS